jgi:hypothetical protein
MKWGQVVKGKTDGEVLDVVQWLPKVALDVIGESEIFEDTLLFLCLTKQMLQQVLSTSNSELSTAKTINYQMH